MKPVGVNISPEIKQMLEAAHSKRFRTKGVIMREGEDADLLFYVLEGSITILMDNEDGNKLILAYLGPGEFFGELGLFGGSGRSAWVRARTDCTVAILSYNKFIDLCKEMPNLLMQLTGQIARRLRETSRKVGDLAFLDVTGRLAHALLNLTHDSEAKTHPESISLQDVSK